MSSTEQHFLEKNGLYAGNVILELVPDSKGVKPSIKVNNLATLAEIDHALLDFKILCIKVHEVLREAELPITYEQAVEEAKTKKKTKEE